MLGVLVLFFLYSRANRNLHSFPTRRSSDLDPAQIDFLKYDVTNFAHWILNDANVLVIGAGGGRDVLSALAFNQKRSEEHTSELQSPYELVCRLLLEKKKKLRERKPPTRAMP